MGLNIGHEQAPQLHHYPYHLKDCPVCLSTFPATRPNKVYCSKKCQQNASRGPRNRFESLEERKRNQNHYGRARWLAVGLYQTKPEERLGYMKQLVDSARSGDAQLRNIFTDHKLLHPDNNERWLFYRNCPGQYKTISQAADLYCKKYMYAKGGIREVLRKDYIDPPTGEVE